MLLDPGSEIWDPGWKKSGSGINIPDPQHCLQYSLFYAFSLQCKAQPGEPLRLATGGSDAHVVIWNVKEGDEGKVHNPLLFRR